ncbi:MAG TPA: heme exporter protein CcmB [Acidimicrobiales bacterium]|nr:heme exporter protein CcmB [Acidimicrobiales bacterium]
MFRDAALVAGKDLRIEARSRVATNQVAPLAVVMLVVFAFALDPDRGVLDRASAGLFWVAVMFAAILAVQRSVAVETPATRDGLRLSGLDTGGIFLGKVIAIAVQLLGVEAMLSAGIVVLYGASLSSPIILVATCALATVCLAAAGALYGVLSGGAGVRETLLPLLLVPVAAPVVLAATKAWEAGIAGATLDAWPWLRLLAVLAVVEVAAGIVGYGSLLEES